MPVDSLKNAMSVSVSGLKAQTQRMKVVSENIANANSFAENAQDIPYRRKTISFKSHLDRNIDAHLVEVGNVGIDPSKFSMKYEPHHPAADDNGYVKYSNVNVMVEMWDMQQANRSYKANLSSFTTAMKMYKQTVDLLR